LLSVSLKEEKLKIEKEDFAKAKTDNTIKSYNDFISKYSSSTFIAEAADSIYSLNAKEAFNSAKEKMERPFFKIVIDSFPECRFVEKSKYYLDSLIKVEENKRFGTFKDKRDGKTYKWVRIGNQVWMAENLAYKPGSGNYWAYDDKQSNVAKYGYLYDWKTAKNACPNGWHLPTKQEFETLLNNYGGKGEQAYKALIKGGNSNLNVLFGGWRDYGGYFSGKGGTTGFWSATEDNGTSAWGCALDTNDEDADMGDIGKSVGLSVRLLRD
ncbi:MAG: FISUMP domain-containing protein, partial [Bacteroidota bacterium]|nr:FISUMP domain-containing protein [Bacteroidota bacterium]